MKILKKIRKSKMNKKDRHGQAAIEFLVTYGWALLGILIVIGALLYFGIFNTAKYTADVCSYGEQLKREDHALKSNGLLRVQLRNNFEETIDINSVMYKSNYGNATCNNISIVPNATAILPSHIVDINCTIATGPLPINDKLRIKSIIMWSKTGGGNPVHRQTGDITATVLK
jgi:hypothetical protein